MRTSFLLALFLLAALLPVPTDAGTLADRLRGYVLLQVQQHGEAWYVSPTDGTRTYMKDGAAAFSVMRSHGLGITDADLASLLAGNASLKSRLLGRILLQVQQRGEAFYVCPRDGAVTYMKDGAAAFAILRACGLGITDADLANITVAGTAPAPLPGNVATIANCQVFPADNPWNRDISKDPLHPNSATYVASIGAGGHLHPDFGGNGEYGIPFNVVPGTQPKVPITWTAYGDESDPGPYPIPPDAKVENGSDSHVLVLDSGACKLYELYAAAKTANGWMADSGATFDLKSNALRPEGWTSADAAGLPILPGLVRYDEVAAGEVRHAIRFTASRTQNGWIHPATHHAGSNDPSRPPMGLRMRLKASYDLSGYTGHSRVILEAMKKYGLILADNGSNWFFTGASDARWDDDDLNQMKAVPGSAFEAVYTGEILR
jgi:hypothetical protein